MSAWDLWRQIDEREAAKPRLRAVDDDGPRWASSSIQATAWLMKFAPDRLRPWLDRHADGLERATLKAMA